MKLTCELEVVYSLAVESGRGLQGLSSRSKSNRAKACLTVGKKPVSNGGSSECSGKREELFFIVSTTKNVSGSKYKVRKQTVLKW